MSSLFTVIIFIALNIVPSKVTVFEIVDPAGRTVNGQPVEKVIRFTKLPSGGWQVVDLPRDQFGTCHFDGQVLTIAPPSDEPRQGRAKPMTAKMKNFLNLPEAPDWSVVSEIALRSGGRASLSRRATEVSVGLVPVNGDKNQTRSFVIRWREENVVSGGVTKAGDGMGTNYFGADALASIQRLTTEASWDPGITVLGLSRVLTNIYPTMLAYAQELPLSPTLAGRPKTFRFAWSGTSMNPTCFVVRFELCEMATRLTAAQFRFDSQRAPPYNGLARGERVLREDERRRLHRALDEFLTTRPLAYPGTGATDIHPELFEYRDDERYLVAAGNGVCSTNVLGALHQLCLEAVRATKLQRLGSTNVGLGPGHTNATDAQVIVEIVGGFGHLTSLELKSDGSFTWHGWEPGRRIASVRKGRLRTDELGAIVELAARIQDSIAEDTFAGGKHSCSLVLRTSDRQAREIKINQAEADHRPSVLKRLLDLLWATRKREEQK